MSSLEAAVGRAQLERLDELIEARQRNAAYYRERLGDVVEFLKEQPYARAVCWMFGILLRDRDTREGLMQFLAGRDIETRAFFLPMNRQPVYKSDQALPVAEDLGQRGLYLPSASHLSDQDKDTVIQAVREYLTGRR